ncbi:sulfurtransferase complex subunit TusB [Sodalis endosymbiont of Henestaris halophilus]|uniref:sulfurtransferase complex subunit TusB n=1 Tax=Sodalis endosymbiont of Henestaris halophilus TaxID=1929246 RepID=UPI000BC0F1AC|nr:sulfurtransferase complex subunit TusB [Sodalis endosymbiont of Henestaris halophilus]SNC58373.1 Protein TusB [Sodalis endosymbiont of Henestaris halophilus]
MLYTLSHSPYSRDLAALLRTVRPGDVLLLLSDGVIAGLRGSPSAHDLSVSSLILQALENDIAARGLFAFFSPNIAIVSYTDFVKLTEKQIQQIAW